MNPTDDLLDRNRRFAATDAKDRVPQIPFVPNRQLYVITCIDPRVDPAAVLDLALGDAVVARTVGGRVTRAVLDDLAWISYLHETLTPDADWFDIAVVHHTDCGSGLMADDGLRAGFVARGFDDATLLATAVTDPSATVPGDVRLVVDDPAVSGAIRVGGYTYDVTSGLVTEIVGPASRDGARVSDSAAGR